MPDPAKKSQRRRQAPTKPARTVLGCFQALSASVGARKDTRTCQLSPSLNLACFQCQTVGVPCALYPFALCSFSSVTCDVASIFDCCTRVSCRSHLPLSLAVLRLCVTGSRCSCLWRVGFSNLTEYSVHLRDLFLTPPCIACQPALTGSSFFILVGRPFSAAFPTQASHPFEATVRHCIQPAVLSARTPA